MGKGSCCPKLCANREFTVYRLVREFKSKLITAIVLHQFCSPCLVLPVGGRASRGGGGGRVAGGKQSTRVDFDRS